MSEGQGQPDFLERSWHLFCFQNVPWLHKPKEGAGADMYLELFPFFSTAKVCIPKVVSCSFGTGSSFSSEKHSLLFHRLVQT